VDTTGEIDPETIRDPLRLVHACQGKGLKQCPGSGIVQSYAFLADQREQDRAFLNS